VILRPGARLTARDLFEGCGLTTWRFSHLPAGQELFRPYHWREAPSPYIDLSRGFDAYCQERRRAKSPEVGQALKKMRKAQNQIGLLRLEADTGDDGVFRWLLQRKSDQYLRTKRPDALAFPWVTGLLEWIRRQRGGAFSGMLSALYLGDRLAAAYFGMRCRGVLHSWFVSYDLELRQYSPGLVLFLKLAEIAPSLGIHRIDLGKGPEEFKLGLMSGASRVAEGAVELRRLARTLRQGWFRTREWVRATPLRGVARTLAGAIRPGRAAKDFL
jgi:CelD/BcsL family acetyltransferase involved in cellulose biosynthesis